MKPQNFIHGTPDIYNSISRSMSPFEGFSKVRRIATVMISHATTGCNVHAPQSFILMALFNLGFHINRPGFLYVYIWMISSFEYKVIQRVHNSIGHVQCIPQFIRDFLPHDLST
jgi:hypothetical protein